MAKKRLKYPGELHKPPESEEWQEVEFTESFELISKKPKIKPKTSR